MKVLTFWLAVLFGLAMLIVCCDDPRVLPIGNSIAGSYTGWIILDSLGDAGGLRDSQPYDWTFTRDSFTYARADSIPDSVPLLFAECYGTYELADGLVLTPEFLSDPDPRSQVRNALHGTFVILLHTKTELTFVQGGSGSRVVTVRLTAD